MQTLQSELKSVSELPENLPKTDRLAAIKQVFLEMYRIQILGDSQLALILPEGTSRIDFLKSAQELAKQLHRQNAIYDSRLNSWAVDKNFNSKAENEYLLAVDMNVKDSTRLNRFRMEKKGWLDLGIEDLAVCHAAYYIATGKDAFAGNTVRARGGSLYFSREGIEIGSYERECCSVEGSFKNVSASRTLLFPKLET